MSSFSDLGVPARLVHVLTDLGLDTPTPIQSAALPDAINGRDVLGRGRTGSGKTLAFLLPLVARLADGGAPRSGAPRALILAPTRELAGQIDEALRPLAAATGLRSTTIFGGVSQRPQVAALSRGVDIVVACPGRLEDLIQQRHCSLRSVEITVLDEADHMADLGFLPAVRRLLAATPAGGQRMLFSATLDRAVDALVRQFLVRPAVHEADSAQSPVGTMTHHLLEVQREARLAVLVELTSRSERTVVFTRTKHGAKALAKQLNREGVPAVELHGNLAQNARTRNLADFHGGRAAALVATDIAARGIHVDDVSLVIHADPPAEEKAYLHRSGRTARAGNAGTVVTLMTRDQQREVQRMTRAAGIKATVSRIVSTDDPALNAITPGPRLSRARLPEVHTPAPSGRPRTGSGSGSGRRRRPSSGAAASSGSGRRRNTSRPAASSGSSNHSASNHSASKFSSGRR